MLQENAEEIWKQYQKIKGMKSEKQRQWQTGENLWIVGEEYTIERIVVPEKKEIEVYLKEKEKILALQLPSGWVKKEEIEKKIVQMLKKKTAERLEKRLPFWCKQTGFSYQTLRISDTKSKYGSCMPKKGALQFSARLAMLLPKEMDAIIVHELCHFRYANHSKEFYELVQKYIPNYAEIQKELKLSGRKIFFERS